MQSDRRDDAGARVDFEEVRQDIETRVRRVCGDWPDEEIFGLTTRMARIQLKYRRSTSMPKKN
jgi:hypothetical protein